jgi:hypothetical protein
MAKPKKIAVLLHEKDRYPNSTGHFIWGLCRVWREQGLGVEIVKGTRKKIDADVIIPHIDATVLPSPYVEFLEKQPRVVNRRLNDISKRLISRNILARTDAYDGRVIVKTNLNCGGGPDVNFAGAKVFFSAKRAFAWLNKKKSSSDWQKINCMECEDYQVFPSLKEVPEAVFDNPWLVVERFLPEQQNGIYYLRVYQFCGEQGYCSRWGSPHPVVKRRNIVSREEVGIPEEVMAVRRELGMDYGKLDFVIHEGRPIVFDANRTPGLIHPESRMKQKALQLAPGILSLF